MQVVGCLTQGAEQLVDADAHDRAGGDAAGAAAATSLKTAEAKPLGAQTFQLVSVTPFKPEAHKGQKMEARGLLYRDDTDARLNLTSLQMLNSSCQ